MEWWAFDGNFWFGPFFSREIAENYRPGCEYSEHPKTESVPDGDPPPFPED